MKTLHLSIIIGAGIFISIVLSILLINPEGISIFGNNIPIKNIEKLSDFYKIKNIQNPNDIGNDDGISAGDFDWSHDGKLVAFSMSGGSPVEYLWVMTSDGKQIRELHIPIEFNYVDYIHFSPSDDSIYFVGQYNNKNETYQDIFRYDLHNDMYSFVTKNLHLQALDFMPDGNIVYLENHSNSTRLEKDRPLFLIKHYSILWLAHSDGTKIKSLYNGTEFFNQMAASPDGTKLVSVFDEDPNHPSSNGTDIEDMGRLGPPEMVRSYLALYDNNEKNFVILGQLTNGESYSNPKWVDNNTILFGKLLHQCVQDKTLGEQSCPAGILELMDISQNSVKILYGNQAEPYTSPLIGTTINPSKDSLIFAINYDYSNGNIDGKGIYLMEFEKSLVSSGK
ncbi:MAG: hypothetical protein HY223_10450 [Thaumarchaeota archaeon]|nr:hypothetical protein [Nitrososphaerota archaeon]